MQDRLNDLHAALARRYPMYKANPAFEGWLLEQTDADPMLVEQYLEMLDDHEFISGDGTLSGDYTTLPALEHLADAIRRRLDQLAPETRPLLQHASIEGAYFSIDALAALEDSTPQDAAHRLQPAVDSGVVVRDGSDPLYSGFSARYRFVPMQAREVLYQELTDADRAHYHGRMVEYLGRELERTEDVGAREMLSQMLSDHNKHITRPE